jgi:hypothetical protein
MYMRRHLSGCQSSNTKPLAIENNKMISYKDGQNIGTIVPFPDLPATKVESHDIKEEPIEAIE